MMVLEKIINFILLSKNIKFCKYFSKFLNVIMYQNFLLFFAQLWALYDGSLCQHLHLMLICHIDSFHHAMGLGKKHILAKLLWGRHATLIATSFVFSPIITTIHITFFWSPSNICALFLIHTLPYHTRRVSVQNPFSKNKK